MIEAAATPGPGSTVKLRRMELEIGGTVVWQSGGRCGIEFDGTASVEEWVAGKRLAPRRYAAEVRAEKAHGAAPDGRLRTPGGGTASSAARDPSELDARISQELSYARRMLGAVGEELAQDPILLQRHARSLQNFDAACQIIEHLSHVIGATDRAAAVDAMNVGDLRNRLMRKAIF